jgi:hypothetical protein
MNKIKEYLQKTVPSFVLFMFLLVVVPLVGQYAYFSLAPANWIMDVHSYKASDVNLTEPMQTICVDRTLRHNFQGEWIDELYLRDADTDELLKVYSVTGESIYAISDGNKQTFYVDLSEVNLEEGLYYWSYSIRGRFPAHVDRTFTFESNEFEVYI